jgi:GT2 family glycosyltransferase
VSIIVVLYNSADYIEACVDSIRRIDYPHVELIMVDNGSSDDSAQLARQVAHNAGVECSISILKGNKGFAAANNHGFTLSSGEIVLLLNPDTELYPDAVGSLVSAFQDPSVGICGCKVFYPDRVTLQHTGGWMRDNGLTMHYGVGEKDTGVYDEMRDVFYVTGAAFAVRRGVFERAGLLDAGYYPAYFEETDLCLAVRRLGLRVVYVPGACLVHHESTTTGKFTERYYYLYHKNRIRFLLKNFSWRFLLNRSLPMEQEWLGIIAPWEQSVPLNKAYLANIIALPRTLSARWKLERRIRAPRMQDTVPHLREKEDG